MTKNVMKLLKPSPKLGKNGFDLSHRKLFDAKMGELLPCCCIETVPDDDIEIRVSDLLRAMPMVTSPFLRVKQHIDFWFVPFNALWHNFNAFITSRQESDSSRYQDFQYCPHFNLRSMKSLIASTSQVDIFGSASNFEENAYRLLDLLGYPTYDKYYGDPADPPTVSDDIDVNPWRLAAYQFIWYKEYRQKYYDNGSLGFGTVTDGNYSPMWNFDYLPANSYGNADIMTNAPSVFPTDGIICAICQMRYRPWKKDLFTGLMPSTQLGLVSTISSSEYFLKVTNYSTGGATPSVFTDISGKQRLAMNSSGGTVVSGSDNWSLSGSLSDVLALRSAMALQVWRENALRAGNQIEDNYEAHYGVKPKSHSQEHPVAIGSIDAPLNISDVTATASTGTGDPNSSVGDIAGKGISSIGGDKVLRFKTNDFGVVMGIFSLLPEAEYNSTGVDRPNQLLDRYDYFMPEMENLGLEAVDSGNFTLDSSHFVMGYAPRYYGYKQIMDKAHLKFQNNPSSGLNLGPYRAWASAKYDLSSGINALPLKSLYVDPAIFGVNFVSSSDQFLVDMYNDVKAVRPMSVTGMPSK